ncbi:MAG: hypothetical protein JXX29_03665 [Deltaproteobacteria bacterium]|nr:hypothetical protein [Deltaproteobacteria bacterium]MBN2670740.1 hypothetical protein [Deltaproteobacteria bacterium]
MAINTLKKIGCAFFVSTIVCGCTKHLPLEWEPCETSAQTASADVTCRVYPIDAEGKTRNIYVKRLTPDAKVHTQLWLFMGGVGEPGTEALDPMLALLHQVLPHTEIFTFDAYGTGRSDYLTCPSFQTRFTESGTLCPDIAAV